MFLAAGRAPRRPDIHQRHFAGKAFGCRARAAPCLRAAADWSAAPARRSAPRVSRRRRVRRAVASGRAPPAPGTCSSGRSTMSRRGFGDVASSAIRRVLAVGAAAHAAGFQFGHLAPARAAVEQRPSDQPGDRQRRYAVGGCHIERMCGHRRAFVRPAEYPPAASAAIAPNDAWASWKHDPDRKVCSFSLTRSFGSVMLNPPNSAARAPPRPGRSRPETASVRQE